MQSSTTPSPHDARATPRPRVAVRRGRLGCGPFERGWVRMLGQRGLSTHSLIELLESRSLFSAGFDVVLVDGSLTWHDAIAGAARNGAVVVTYDGSRESSTGVLARVAGMAAARGEMLSSLSIVSHGRAGAFALGKDIVDASALDRTADAWRAIGRAMIEGAGISILSCEVAADKTGVLLVNQLAGLTGRGVFASSNLTGDGGDWTLEVASSSDRPAFKTRMEPPLDTDRLAAMRGLTLSMASGSETAVNTTTANTQNAGFPRAIAADAAGNYVVTWESYDQDSPLSYGIYARRFNAAGVPQGPEFLVNSGFLLNDQRAPAVAMNASGDFVIAWEGTGLLGLFPGIYAQRYNAAGVAQGGEIGVDGSLLLTLSGAAVAMDNAGNFVVAYEGQDSALQGVFARRYAANGTPLGASFQVNVTSAGNQRAPDVAITSSGGFAISWHGQGTGDTTGAFARVYDAAGAAVSGEVRVNTFTTGTQSNTAIAAASAAAGGGIIVVWSGRGATDTTGIHAQRLSSAGALVGSVLEVNVTTTGTQQIPSIAIDPNGDFMITWNGQGAGDTAGVFGREYASDAAPRTGEFLINTTTAGTQAHACVAAGPDNVYIVAWDGQGVGDSAGVFFQRYVNAPPAAATTGWSLSYTENAAATAVDAGITLSDSDNTLLSGAAASISGNFALGQDVLAFVDQGGITGSWNGTTGVLTLSGVASLAAYQAALRSITYANTSDNPSTLTRTVTFIVNDGSATSPGAARSITLTAVNDPPTVTTTGSALSYSENAGAVVVDDGLLVADLDHATISGATVTISDGYVSGEDVLGFANVPEITGSWNEATGVLTLTGTAALSAYQNALRSITYANVSDNPSTITRTVSFAVNDGTDPSAAATRNVAVIASNDPPMIGTTVTALNYTENDAPTAIDPGLTISDPDNATLSGAAVAVSSGFVSGEDVLTFVNQSGITGSWNAATGVLTLSGTASVAAYQTALRSITYANVSDNPSTTARTVSFVVSDGADPSAAATRDIAVAAVNDAPTAAATSTPLAYTENDAATPVDPGITIGDVDNIVLTGALVSILGGFVSGEDVLAFVDQAGITGSWNGATGVLTLSGTASVAAYQAALRSITYRNTSDDPSVTERLVSFEVNDGTASSAAAIRAVSVTAVNDAPVVTTAAGTLVYVENSGPVALDAGLTIADADNTILTGAAVTISGGYVLGQDTLLFVNQFGITGSWHEGTATLTLSGAASVADYQAALRSVRFANNSDNPTVGARGISFAVSDGFAASVAAVRTVSVTAVNDPPVVTATGTPLAYTENDAATVVDPGVTVSDVDHLTLRGARIVISGGYVAGQDILAFANQAGITGSWNAATGTLTLNGTATIAAYQAALRSVTYRNTSENPATAPRTITFTVRDVSDESAPATRDITLLAVNDGPQVTTTVSPIIYVENAPAIAVDAGLVITDPDHATLAAAMVAITGNFRAGQDTLTFANQSGITGSWNATTGVLTLTGTASVAAYQAALRSITYRNTSDAPDPAARTVSFVVSDGIDASPAAGRDITVVPQNDAPVVATSSGAQTFAEGSSPVIIDAGVSVFDVDSGVLMAAMVAITGNYAAGQDALIFVDQPGITGSWNAGTGVLTLTGAAAAADYQAALRSIRYGNASANPSPLPRTIAFLVSDGTTPSAAATRSLTIFTVNDAPVVSTAGASITFAENSEAVEIDPTLTIGDADSPMLVGARVSISVNYAPTQDTLSFGGRVGISGVWNAAAGVLTLSGTATVADYEAALRSVRYHNSSDAPSTLPRTITLVVDDGLAQSATAMLEVIIAPENDAPTLAIGSTSVQFAENSPAIVVAPVLSLFDYDSPTFTGATVAITGRFVPGEDALIFIDRSGITGSWNAATGTLTLTGSATVASYQAALRSIRYVNTSENPSAQSRSVTFIIGDELTTVEAAQQVDIQPSNDLPTLDRADTLAAYIENGAPVTLWPELALADPDNGTLAGARVAISAGFAPGEDALGFIQAGGLACSWDAETGVLTITGEAELSAYRAVVSSVTFVHMSEHPLTLNRLVSVAIFDGFGWSDPHTATITLESIPDAPTLSAPSSPLRHSPDSALVAIGADIDLTDLDSPMLTGASITIIGHHAPGEDLLFITDQPGISVLWDAEAGVLTLTGSASREAYTAAIRSLLYANAASDPSRFARTISITVTDETGLTASLDRQIVFAEPETPPVDPPVEPPANPLPAAAGMPEVPSQIPPTAGAGSFDPSSVTDAAVAEPSRLAKEESLDHAEPSLVSKEAPQQATTAPNATAPSIEPAAAETPEPTDTPMAEEPAAPPAEQADAASQPSSAQSSAENTQPAAAASSAPASQPQDPKAPVNMPIPPPIPAQLVSELATLQQQLQAGAASATPISSTVVAVTAGGIGVAYVTLAARAGMIGAALLPGVPVWSAIDPATLLKTQSSLAKAKFFFKR